MPKNKKKMWEFEIEYDKFGVAGLKQLAKERGMKNYNKLRRKELISLHEKYDNNIEKLPKEEKMKIIINNLKKSISKSNLKYTDEYINPNYVKGFSNHDWAELSDLADKEDISFTSGIPRYPFNANFILFGKKKYKYNS